MENTNSRHRHKLAEFCWLCPNFGSKLSSNLRHRCVRVLCVKLQRVRSEAIASVDGAYFGDHPLKRCALRTVHGSDRLTSHVAVNESLHVAANDLE